MYFKVLKLRFSNMASMNDVSWNIMHEHRVCVSLSTYQSEQTVHSIAPSYSNLVRLGELKAVDLFLASR